MTRREAITRPATFDTQLAPGVTVCLLATGSLGARGLTTSLASFTSGARLPYHEHPCSEVIIVLTGGAWIYVAGRRYLVQPYDAMHVPAGTPHAVENDSLQEQCLLHSSFASDEPVRRLVESKFTEDNRHATDSSVPERLVRFAEAPVYELAGEARFRDLFARRLGSRGICGGYGLFAPGASLPCHFHAYDESITIVTGQAVCQVAGREYLLADAATACVPTGLPHRFLNRSASPMAMIWVYAGDEPERTLVDANCCIDSRAAMDLFSKNTAVRNTVSEHAAPLVHERTDL